MTEGLLDRVTASGNGWQRNIYSGTVVCSNVLNIGVCFPEIMGCSLAHPQYENLLICRVVNSKEGIFIRLMYTQVLSNPIDINKNCLMVCHGWHF
jgi:hypothetical protein